jgi:hypothetical protein
VHVGATNEPPHSMFFSDQKRPLRPNSLEMLDLAFKIETAFFVGRRQLVHRDPLDVAVNGAAVRSDPNLCIQIAFFKKSYQAVDCHTLSQFNC